MNNWWEYQKRYRTTLFCMIATFLVLLCVGICLGLMAVPVLFTAVFNHWLWLLLWIITIPLCVGVFDKLIDFLD